MSDSLVPLEQTLYHALVPWLNAKCWRVAFSGGLDSSALLHALWKIAQVHAVPPIQAVHVEHGLQAVSQTWPAHCAAFCLKRDIAFRAIKVSVANEASIEQAARNARYQAFANLLAEGDVVLLAQHQDDQAETFLFRALRGAGVQGLAAMAKARPLGQGYMVRPMLGIARCELERYAEIQNLVWVEDPSNTDTRFARNFLRLSIFPQLKQHWPKVAQTMARSSEHLADAQVLLDELAQEDLIGAQGQQLSFALPYPFLMLEPLKRLNPRRQRNALRFWLRAYTLLPDTEHWAGWEALVAAKSSATPRWVLGQYTVCRAEERIWLVPSETLLPPLTPMPVVSAQVYLPGNGALAVEAADFSGSLGIGYRQGGEVLTLKGRGRRDLKRLFNELKVPEYIRHRVPLLRVNDEIVAVANLPTLWQEGFKLIWTPETD